MWSEHYPLIISIVGAAILGVTGGLLTQIGPWYRGLEKSRLNPPDWVFGPAWTTIYVFGVTSIVFGWAALTTDGAKATFIALWVINAVLNGAWSLLFFKLKRPDWALIDLAVFWVSIAAILIFILPYSLKSALFGLPYLLWVCFAAHLNIEVVRKNGPFGQAA